MIRFLQIGLYLAAFHANEGLVLRGSGHTRRSAFLDFTNHLRSLQQIRELVLVSGKSSGNSDLVVSLVYLDLDLRHA